MELQTDWIRIFGVYVPVYSDQLQVVSSFRLTSFADLGFLRFDALGWVPQWGSQVFQQCTLLQHTLWRLSMSGRYLYADDELRTFLTFVKLGTPCIIEQRFSILIVLEQLNAVLQQLSLTSDVTSTFRGLRLENFRI